MVAGVGFSFPFPSLVGVRGGGKTRPAPLGTAEMLLDGLKLFATLLLLLFALLLLFVLPAGCTAIAEAEERMRCCCLARPLSTGLRALAVLFATEEEDEQSEEAEDAQGSESTGCEGRGAAAPLPMLATVTVVVVVTVVVAVAVAAVTPPSLVLYMGETTRGLVLGCSPMGLASAFPPVVVVVVAGSVGAVLLFAKGGEARAITDEEAESETSGEEAEHSARADSSGALPPPPPPSVAVGVVVGSIVKGDLANPSSLLSTSWPAAALAVASRCRHSRKKFSGRRHGQQ